MHFDLVSPERLLISSDVAQVDVPGSEGDFGVLAGHAPLVTTMRPGILVIYRDGQDPLRIVINGGFAEVGPNGLTVLADTAVPIDEFDAAARAGVIKDTEEDIAGSTDGWQRDRLTRRLEQLHELQRALAS
jgi:F-type H+-transporting ATPase subunit epsilon